MKQEIRKACDVPFEFHTIAICDGLAMGHEGASTGREVIANFIELMALAHRFDAMVFIVSCDKIIPGMLMAAAARLDIPSVFVLGGAIPSTKATWGF